jgi:hypothetical protein
VLGLPAHAAARVDRDDPPTAGEDDGEAGGLGVEGVDVARAGGGVADELDRAAARRRGILLAEDAAALAGGQVPATGGAVLAAADQLVVAGEADGVDGTVVPVSGRRAPSRVATSSRPLDAGDRHGGAVAREGQLVDLATVIGEAPDGAEREVPEAALSPSAAPETTKRPLPARW